jgi:hypothetical protein
MMEAASTSETWVNFYLTTRRNNPEDSHLHERLSVSLLLGVSKFVRYTSICFMTSKAEAELGSALVPCLGICIIPKFALTVSNTTRNLSQDNSSHDIHLYPAPREYEIRTLPAALVWSVD